MKELDVTRARILGVLIQDARRHAGRSIADCAQVLNISPEDLAKAEQGEHILSLPELEALALYLDVPMAHFWGNKALNEKPTIDYASLLALRHRIIGALLRHARIEASRSPGELAGEIKVDAEQIHRYELGLDPVPLFQLERVGKFLGVTMDYFVDEERGPLKQHEARHKMQKRFAELPPEVRAFVVEPINLSYLETAMRLSEMDVNKLRNIAEGILDITF